MRRSKRIPPRSILIACEGTVTEFAYFERLKEEIEENGRWAVTVYPDRDAPSDQNPKTSALQLVKLAKERSADFDEVWVVFDKDGYALHPEAFALARSDRQGKRLHIAFSSIAFEQWVLAHFERNVTAFAKSECRQGKKPIGCGTARHQDDCKGTLCICGRLRTLGYLPAYGKNADYDLYPKIRHLIPTAISHAAWLRSKLGRKDDPIFDANPYTDVDVLVKALLDIDDHIEWAGLHDVVLLQTLAFQLHPTENALQLIIQNLGSTAIVLNQIAFAWLDSTGQNEQLQGRK